MDKLKKICKIFRHCENLQVVLVQKLDLYFQLGHLLCVVTGTLFFPVRTFDSK